MISPITNEPTVIAEVRQSNQLAEGIHTLQSLIERNAAELARIKEELKHKRESLKSVFENDSEFSQVSEEVEKVQQTLKQAKSKMQSQPQVVAIKTSISELAEQKKEIEETLSNHLVNYYQMTNSNSVDTSNGDQAEFTIKATIKSKQLRLFE